MRKLLRITTTFALGLLLTAGMAFGQNSVDLDQSDGSTADIQQTANNGSNTVEGLNGGSSGLGGNAFTQVGGSDATIIQKVNGGGASHYVQAEQLDGGKHEIFLKQNGKAGQGAIVDQKEGSNNLAKLKQRSGNVGNRATIVQRGDDKVRGPNSPGVSPTVNFTNPGAGNAQQFGNSHVLTVSQFGSNPGGGNELISQQLGFNHKIGLSQNYGSYAEIIQDGQNNFISNKKNRAGKFKSWNADLFVEQIGIGNKVWGSQSSPSATSPRNTAYVSQSGGSEARMIQQ